MKYQTFNSSCCYACLANMLDDHSIDVEDRDIVKAIELPYMLRFDRQQNSFLAGAMLQGQRWFDLFLRPNGLHYAERSMSPEAVVNFLASADGRVMLGIKISDETRSALVFDGIRGSRFHFLNIKWADSEGAERYMFTAQELYDRLEGDSTLGWIESSTVSAPDLPEELCATLSCIAGYCASLHEFCDEPRDKAMIRWAVEPLFRPMLLDLPTMMEIAGEARIVLMLRVLQRSFAAAMDSVDRQVRLFDFISEQQLDETLDRYAEIVQTRLKILMKNRE